MHPFYPGGQFHSVPKLARNRRQLLPQPGTQNNHQQPLTGGSYDLRQHLIHRGVQNNLVYSPYVPPTGMQNGPLHPQNFGNLNSMPAYSQNIRPFLFPFDALAYQLLSQCCLGRQHFSSSSPQQPTSNIRFSENCKQHQNSSDRKSNWKDNKDASGGNLTENCFKSRLESPSNAQIQESNPNKSGQCGDFTEWKNSPRFWKVLRRGRETNGSMEISVMSYNVLSQSLLEEHGYLYRNCCDKDLDWSVRGPALIKQFQYHNSDILCLQEVQKDHWENFFEPQLKSFGYEGVFLKRTGSKPDGCAILYRCKKFKLIKFVPVEFQRGGLLDRDNVGVIVLLKPRGQYYGGNVPKICVATTHLLFNPKRGDIKLAQLMLFMAEIEKHSYIEHAKTQTNETASHCSAPYEKVDDEMTASHPYCPVILCGDLNLLPHSFLYKFIARGYLRYNAYTSHELSGQQEGWGRGGQNYYVSTQLLPEFLGINDHCQFIQQTLNRLSPQVPCVNNSFVNLNCGYQSNNPERIDHQESSSSHQNVSFSENGNTTPVSQGIRLSDKGTGQAFHDFKFESVYSQGKNHHSLVTTHHDRASCAVDYIFFSTGKTIPNNMCNSKTFQNENVSKSESERKKRKRSESSDSQPHTSSNAHKTCRAEHESIVSDLDIDKKLQSFKDSKTSDGDNIINSLHRDNLLQDSSEQSDGCEIVDSVNSESDSTDKKNRDNLTHSKLFSKHQDIEDNRNVLPDLHIDNTRYESEGPVKLDRNANMQNRYSKNFPKNVKMERLIPIKALELVATWSLLSRQQMNQCGTIPNHIFPSDHMCLIAKFLLH